MDSSEDQAARLILALDDLIDGERAIPALIALGPSAIPPLRRFLIERDPTTVYHPRRWAVRALAALDAREVLVEYLLSPHHPDPEIRLAEEAVRNAAILEFLRWPDRATIRFLLELSQRYMLPALAEVFGSLRVEEAIPFLDRSLEDDVCRPAAETALAAIGEPARAPLLLSLDYRMPTAETESPSSLRRRRAILRVLAEIGPAPADAPRIAPLLGEPDPEIAIRAAVLLARAGVRSVTPAAAERLIELTAGAPWFLLSDLEDCLVAWAADARPLIQATLARRAAAPLEERVRDQSLRVLLRVARRAGWDPAAPPPPLPPCIL